MAWARFKVEEDLHSNAFCVRVLNETKVWIKLYIVLVVNRVARYRMTDPQHCSWPVSGWISGGAQLAVSNNLLQSDTIGSCPSRRKQQGSTSNCGSSCNAIFIWFPMFDFVKLTYRFINNDLLKVIVSIPVTFLARMARLTRNQLTWCRSPADLMFSLIHSSYADESSSSALIFFPSPNPRARSRSAFLRPFRVSSSRKGRLLTTSEKLAITISLSVIWYFLYLRSYSVNRSMCVWVGISDSHWWTCKIISKLCISDINWTCHARWYH